MEAIMANIISWISHLSELGLNLEMKQAAALLKVPYSTPPRAYHNLKHVYFCIDGFWLLKELARKPLAVETAIWCHDIVYDPANAKENEINSALCTREMLERFGLESAFVKLVSDLILFTQYHRRPETVDEMILRDCDLRILGTDREMFDEYERSIRQEYQDVPRQVFCDVRRGILERLRKNGIFSTPVFQQMYEDQAQANLERSIEKLKQGIC